MFLLSVAKHFELWSKNKSQTPGGLCSGNVAKVLEFLLKFPVEEVHILKHIPSGCSASSYELKLCVCLWVLRERALWGGVERSVAG